MCTVMWSHSKNRIVILAVISRVHCRWMRCVDTVNCQDGMIMWRKVGWEWGKDCHVVLLHIVINCVHSSESEITNCQSLWHFLFSARTLYSFICYFLTNTICLVHKVLYKVLLRTQIFFFFETKGTRNCYIGVSVSITWYFCHWGEPHTSVLNGGFSLGRAWASPYLVMSTWTLSVCP